jgi:AraC family transcriptional regulator
MRGVVVERDLEDARAQFNARADAGTKHVLVVSANTAGRLAWTSSGRRREALYTPHDLILNPAGAITSPQWKAPMELILFAIEPGHLASVAEVAGAAPRIELPEKFRFEDGLLEHLVRTLVRQFENEIPPDLLYTESLTQTLLLHLIRTHSDTQIPAHRQRSSVSEPRVQRAIDFIQGNLSSALSLAQIAREAELNSSQFCNIFKTVIGLSPHQYVMRQRVEKAISLLKETTIPISEIALQTGFADQSHLTRVLRRQHGLTPRQIRS